MYVKLLLRLVLGLLLLMVIIILSLIIIILLLLLFHCTFLAITAIISTMALDIRH